MKNIKIDKKMKGALVALMMVGVAGATWAWFSDSAIFENTFTTGKYSDEIIEEFTPPKDWKPGDITDKKVTVTNTGDVDMVVRVKFSEQWDKDKTTLGNHFGEPETADNASAIKNLNMDNVIENMEKSDKWYVVYDTCGCPLEAYYLDALKSNESTTELLQSVTMNPKIPSDTKSEKLYIVVVDGQDQEMSEDEFNQADQSIKDTLKGYKYKTETSSAYSDAIYVLNITAETVQATREAILDVWQNNALSKPSLEDYINTVLGA